jgi:hypothetical protein
MFDTNKLGGSSKYLNAKFLQTLPEMATKVRITGGGEREIDDRDNPGKKKWELYLTVFSTINSFEGEMEMGLNKTNLAILMTGLGKQPNSWKGEEIGVYFNPDIKFGGKPVGGLSIKVFKADPFAKMAAVAPTAAPVEADAIPF